MSSISRQPVKKHTSFRGTLTLSMRKLKVCNSGLIGFEFSAGLNYEKIGFKFGTVLPIQKLKVKKGYFTKTFYQGS